MAEQLAEELAELEQRVEERLVAARLAVQNSLTDWTVVLTVEQLAGALRQAGSRAAVLHLDLHPRS